jgi:hypothetical protein
MIGAISEVIADFFRFRQQGSFRGSFMVYGDIYLV